jgi:hypothetical protein
MIFEAALLQFLTPWGVICCESLLHNNLFINFLTYKHTDVPATCRRCKFYTVRRLDVVWVCVLDVGKSSCKPPVTSTFYGYNFGGLLQIRYNFWY